jgi:hypothetical protein
MSTGCGPSGTVYGTVTVTNIVGGVDVNVSLAFDNDVFAVSGAGAALAWDLTGNPDLTGDVSINTPPTPAGFFSPTALASGASIHLDGTGHWEYTIECTRCGPGTSSPTSSGPLDFDIMGVTAADFTKNDKGWFFSVDIGHACSDLQGCAGTGDVTASVGITTFGTAPEPSTWAMMLAGFAFLGYAGYRGRRSSVTAAF